MQWIKLYVSMFSNRKIQLLLSRRDGDMFFRVWIQLLTLAGQSVDNGRIMRSETVPMTVEELAKIMHKNVDKMKSILDDLIHLEMIKYEDNTYIIKNWNEYQSADKYEKTVQQNRERQRRFRDKNKEENNVIVTLGNDTEENIKENNRIDNKKKSFCNYEQREYSPEFLESLYANK